MHVCSSSSSDSSSSSGSSNSRGRHRHRRRGRRGVPSSLTLLSGAFSHVLVTAAAHALLCSWLAAPASDPGGSWPASEALVTPGSTWGVQAGALGGAGGTATATGGGAATAAAGRATGTNGAGTAAGPGMAGRGAMADAKAGSAMATRDSRARGCRQTEFMLLVKMSSIFLAALAGPEVTAGAGDRLHVKRQGVALRATGAVLLELLVRCLQRLARLQPARGHAANQRHLP